MEVQFYLSIYLEHQSRSLTGQCGEKHRSERVQVRRNSMHRGPAVGGSSKGGYTPFLLPCDLRKGQKPSDFFRERNTEMQGCTQDSRLLTHLFLVLYL